MKSGKLFLLSAMLVVLLPLSAFAADFPSWLEITGDYQGRYDYLQGDSPEYFDFGAYQQALFGFYQGPGTILTPEQAGAVFAAGQFDDDTLKNDSLLTNRFRLGFKARATENIQVKARLVMYKVWGENTSDSVDAGFFADRSFMFDGVTGHVPQDNVLRVDTVYATWSNIADLPVWFSVGRRPSTRGIPTNLRLYEEKKGTAGVPGLLVDYAFDGVTAGAAPYIEALPGAYFKICYGKGNDEGYESDAPGTNVPNDTDFFGVNVVPYSTDNLHVEVQWNRAFNIFDNPNDSRANLGDIDQYGAVVMGKIGGFNLFASGAMSVTDPGDETFKMDILGLNPATGEVSYIPDAELAGLLYDCNPATGQCDSDEHTGWAIYVGGRYDIESTKTKIGAEYNHGSKYWITFAPAADDIWTSKLGTRGDVYEVYVIQDVLDKPISENGKAYFRLGYQYYSFKYTGSNNWVGEPKDIDDLSKNDPTTAQFLKPLENAHDVYLTFNVTF